MPDRRKALIDVSSTLHEALEALRSLAKPGDQGVELAIIRLSVAIDYVEDAAGVFIVEMRAAA